MDLSNEPMVEGCILLELNLQENDGLVNGIWSGQQYTIYAKAHLLNFNRIKAVVFGKISGLPQQFKKNARTGFEDVEE